VKVSSSEAEKRVIDEKEAAEKLARVVAQGGPVVERLALKNNKDKPHFRFLYDRESEMHKFYQQKVREFSQTSKESVSGLEETENKEQDHKSPTPSRKRKRQSRWAEQQSEDRPANKLVIKEERGQDFLEQLYPQQADTMASKQAIQQANEQRNMDAFASQYQQAIARAQQLAQSIAQPIAQPIAVPQPIAIPSTVNVKKANRLEYDSDEDTEGGTWEHKARAVEMSKTSSSSTKLTEAAEGKHHLADFLPKDELVKFMERVKAAKEGKKAG
jgi:splicing factor 4